MLDVSVCDDGGARERERERAVPRTDKRGHTHTHA